MSTVRMDINCRRCYNIAQEHLQGGSDEPAKAILRDDSLYQARNEALRAVEDELGKYKKVDKKGPENFLVVMLEDCENCDFRGPLIAEKISPYEMSKGEK